MTEGSEPRGIFKLGCVNPSPLTQLAAKKIALSSRGGEGEMGIVKAERIAPLRSERVKFL